MTAQQPARPSLVAIVLAAVLSSVGLAPAAAAGPNAPGAEASLDQLRWARHWGRHGAPFHDYGNAVTATADAIYVAASSESSPRSLLGVVRYNLDGSLAWASRLRLGTDRRGELGDIAMLADGGIVVTGYTSGATGARLRTIVVEPDGSTRWSHSQGLETHIGLQFQPRLAVGPAGTIYVAGSTGDRFLAVTYGSDGKRGWIRRLDLVPGQPDSATSIAADAAGNAYVTGPIGGGFGGFTTVRIRPSGKIAWRQNQQGAISSTLGPSYVAVAPDGRVVVTGVTESGCGLHAATTYALDERHGMREWLSTYPAQGCFLMEAVGMSVRSDGSVVVAGTQLASGSNHDGVVVSYTADGAEEWVTPYGTAGTDLATGTVIDDGTTYVTGSTDVALSTMDVLTAAFARDGAMIWTDRFDTGNSSERPTNLALVPGGDVVTTGTDWRDGKLEEVLTLSYRRDTAGARHRTDPRDARPRRS